MKGTHKYGQVEYKSRRFNFNHSGPVRVLLRDIFHLLTVHLFQSYNLLVCENIRKDYEALAVVNDELMHEISRDCPHSISLTEYFS